MRSASRTSSAASVRPSASSAATRPSRSRTNAPRIVSARRQRPVRERGHRPIANPDVHEVHGEDGLDLVGVEVQLVATDAPQLDVEHEVGVGVHPHAIDEVDLARELADIEAQRARSGSARR